MMEKKRHVEIMAPAGSWESLHAAIGAGADSVYFGVEHLNMRAQAAVNFTLDDVVEIVRICHSRHVLAYLTLNVVLYDEDLPLMRKCLDAVLQSGVDAVIASDIAAIQYAHSIGLKVHLSTQLNICNLDAVRFFSRYSSRMVLARELSLDQIRAICHAIQEESIVGPDRELVQVELFAHGALCVSISGKCSMSLALYNQSANRGVCLQPCRRKYRVIDDETDQELVIDNRYVMSPKDLCTVEWVDQIVNAGVSVLKLEGRGRSPEYVHTVVSVYRQAVTAALSLGKTDEQVLQWQEALANVYNRGFWTGGYYLGKKLGEWSGSAGSQAKRKKRRLGKVTNYFKNGGIAECFLESGSLQIGDRVLITGRTTGVVEHVVGEVRNYGPSQETNRGLVITFPLPQLVRPNDILYVLDEV